jgi:hypothetical protein
VPSDQRLHLALNAGREHRLLENPHVSRSHRSRAGPAQRFGRCAIEAVGCQAEQHGGLPFSKIITNGLAGSDRISPDAEHFITQGECDAGMITKTVQSAMSCGGATSGSCAKG